MRPLVVATLVLLLVLPGCSSSSGGHDISAKASSFATTTIRGGPTGVLRHSSVTTEHPASATREAQNPDPHFDYGFVVQITRQGFHPQWLVSGCCQSVTWENLTGSTTSVVFDHQLVDSGPIQAGGTFVWTPPHIESITYHAGNNPSMTGALQVNQMFES